MADKNLIKDLLDDETRLKLEEAAFAMKNDLSDIKLTLKRIRHEPRR